jgi:hypothetical protein
MSPPSQGFPTQPTASLELLWFSVLCAAIRGYDAHPSPETAAARDAVSCAYQKVSGIAPWVLNTRPRLKHWRRKR